MRTIALLSFILFIPLYGQTTISGCDESRNFGNYSFKNNYSSRILVALCPVSDYSYCDASPYIIIDPGETDTFYNLNSYPGSNNLYVFVFDPDEFLKIRNQGKYEWGKITPKTIKSILVEKCKLKHLDLKP